MAATKTIILKSVTIHAPGKDHVPFEFGGIGQVIKGKYSVETYPPGKPVTLPADEADRLLRLHDGEEVKPGKATAAA